MSDIRQIELSKIKSIGRLREEYGDIDAMKESLSEKGLLQPIGVREVNDEFILIWGGRRTLSAIELNWEVIEAKVCEIDDITAKEYELEENIRRKDMTWQEKAKGLEEIHRMKKIKGGFIGERWGLRDTGELLGISLGSVAYTLEVGQLLKQGDVEIKSAPTMAEAMRIILRRNEAEAQDKLNKINAAKPGVGVPKADDAFKPGDMDLFAPKPVEVEYRLDCMVKVPVYCNYIIDQASLEHNETKRIFDLAGERSCWVMYEGYDIDYLKNSQPIYVRDDSLKDDTNTLPFVPNYRVCQIAWNNYQFPKVNQQPLIVSNSFVDRISDGASALGRTFWRWFLEIATTKTDNVCFYKPSAVDGVIQAIISGYQVSSVGLTEKQLSYIQTEVSKYGKLTIHNTL